MVLLMQVEEEYHNLVLQDGRICCMRHQVYKLERVGMLAIARLSAQLGYKILFI